MINPSAKILWLGIKRRFEPFKKNKRMLGGFAFMILLLGILLTTFFMTSNGKNKDVPTQNNPNREEFLSRFYLYPPDPLILKGSQEFIVEPEQVDILEEEGRFKEDMLNSKLFNREDEIIQLELNKIY